MNELKTFNHRHFGELQVIVVDGKEHFGATDVAKSLEYKQPHLAIRSHCDFEGVITHHVPTNGGVQEKRFITMGNVSRLIVGAAKQSRSTRIRENAKVYEKWIFDEVIPSIHQTGSYSIEPKTNNTKLLLQTALEHEEKIEAIQTDVKYLKETMRIDGIQEYQINQLGKKIVLKSLGGYKSPAYQEMSGKVFARFWRDFKQHFMLPRYSELPKKKYDEAIEFINAWQPDTSTRLEIESINRQQVMKEVI